ncbi:BamA/OMP85 family outer membrane protein [Muribaculum intestinale]|uniref:BamA/OMP85 family outer membrane protein n=2 Tax=Muribaculum intestinale TaxID=1796646 RepID=UPI003979F3DC
MLNRLLTIIALTLLSATTVAVAQDSPVLNAPVDTVYNPNILYTGMPKSYEIAGIEVTGVPNYEDYIIIGYSGLNVGDRVEIPGPDITNAAKRFARQGLFSTIKIKVAKMAGDKVWLEFALKPQPRISAINYYGASKGEKKDLEERLQLMKGNQITQNIVNRATQIIKGYYSQKGFGNAEVRIDQIEDLSAPNENIVNINIDKNSKVKVHKIYIDGNEMLSDNVLQRAMKKTNEKGKLINLFRQKKFVESDYQDDLGRIIAKYNEKGYRDAKIISDSVVKYDDKNVDVYINLEEGKKYYISNIDWVGNTVYPTEILERILDIRPGDVYNQKLLNKRTVEDEDAVSNLYLNNGYLFYHLYPIEKNVTGDSIALEMRMVEGPQATVNNVIINGNDRLYEKVIRRELRVKPGQLFSKDDLMRSAREIAQTGHFDPEAMDIRPEPNAENGTVDIVFGLESKANDQVEVSFGWGQTGLIGKLALKFTNFSIKNLFNPSSYKGIIPQGEGQTFTISAQTNAKYYQSYSISFLDPWFGGKRPNSLSVSAYYARQTGINSSYYSSNWRNPYGYNYWGSSNYYNDYYQNSYENAYDPNKVLQMIGVTVGIGKRLSWPDDYFTFQAEIGYQWYYLKNWDYLYYMNNGTSNSLTLGLTLARQSIDNPLYTRSGSIFSLNLQLTPPASLFGKKDWKRLSEEGNNGSVEAKKELYRWIEYWKLRFKSRTYTPLTDPAGKWTLVMMTRADFGLLGSYNKYLKTPFETFYVGGDGMSGSYTYATETIALRGYENGQFTPWTREGYAYARVGMELHFPFMLSNSTTIYGLTFVEAGNAWTAVKDFQPFNLKRSAGAGVRIFLPMVGMMGIDWAYGFDTVYGRKGGGQFHFILGQEF